jgi:hypothetical protein
MAFMDDIPLNNGQYVSLDRSISNPQLRVWGQQQTSGNAAHCWVQNKNHTWKNVVMNGDTSPESGKIVINGLKPGEVTVELWDSWNEAIFPTEIMSKTVSPDGKLILDIENLTTDLAFKIWAKQPLQSHQINLNAGWTGISSYLAPENITLDSILNNLNSNLEILSNYSGIYWPDGQVFTIEDWDSYSGYFLKMNSSNQLNIIGLPIENKTIHLSVGWSILPVLSECPVAIEALFGSVYSKLEIVKEIAGNKIFWPKNQVFTLTQLQPGKAYLVKTNEEIEVSFEECP